MSALRWSTVVRVVHFIGWYVKVGGGIFVNYFSAQSGASLQCNVGNVCVCICVRVQQL